MMKSVFVSISTLAANEQKTYLWQSLSVHLVEQSKLSKLLSLKTRYQGGDMLILYLDPVAYQET